MTAFGLAFGWKDKFLIFIGKTVGSLTYKAITIG